jgi:hypothetical protein
MSSQVNQKSIRVITDIVEAYSDGSLRVVILTGVSATQQHSDYVKEVIHINPDRDWYDKNAERFEHLRHARKECCLIRDLTTGVIHASDCGAFIAGNVEVTIHASYIAKVQ